MQVLKLLFLFIILKEKEKKHFNGPMKAQIKIKKCFSRNIGSKAKLYIEISYLLLKPLWALKKQEKQWAGFADHIIKEG